MRPTKAVPEDLTDQVAGDLSPKDVAAYQADIRSRLTDAKWHVDEVMKHYPTEPIGSVLDRICRAQTLLAELSKDLAIVALEQASRGHRLPPSSADPAVNRTKRHGSETRKLALTAGRIPPHLKDQVLRRAEKRGWSESKTVADLLEQALAKGLAELEQASSGNRLPPA
jgi:hypothetical protein